MASMQAQCELSSMSLMTKINLAAPVFDSPIIEIYRRIAFASGAMRDAALRKELDELGQLHENYRDAVNELKNCPHVSEFSSEERKERIRLLLEILDNDALIRDVLHPEMARVGRLLSRFSRSNAAIRAYHRPGSSFEVS